LWGIVGAVTVSAATNAGINLLYLREVKARLEMRPYNRSYFRLLLPLLGASAMVILVRLQQQWFHPAIIAILAALILAYSVFTALVIALGLDEDDRLVARAIASKLGGMFRVAGLDVR
jgi:hypothetical protein